MWNIYEDCHTCYTLGSLGKVKYANMGKQEFLDKLRASLSGNVSARLVEDNVAYYADYINAQLRMGQPEEMVLSSLGDPRLIAKSIITANSGEDYIKNNGTSHYSDYEEEKYYTEPREQKLPKVIHVNGWVTLAIIILVLVLLVSAVFSLISLFFPVIMMGAIVYFFIKVFRDWLN